MQRKGEKRLPPCFLRNPCPSERSNLPEPVPGQEMASSPEPHIHAFMAFLPSCSLCLLCNGDAHTQFPSAALGPQCVFATRSVSHLIFRLSFIKRIIFAEQEPDATAGKPLVRVLPVHRDPPGSLAPAGLWGSEGWEKSGLPESHTAWGY